jgi:hypothetical protein
MWLKRRKVRHSLHSPTLPHPYRLALRACLNCRENVYFIADYYLRSIVHPVAHIIVPNIEYLQTEWYVD